MSAAFPPRSRRTVAGLTRVAVVSLVALAALAAGLVGTAPVDAQGATQFVFQGAGWGHGVGMSQNGARNAAVAGRGHVSILNHYYPNTIVSQVAPLENIRVHIGDASRVELVSEGSIVFERGGVAINAIPSGSISVSAHDGGLQIGNAWTMAARTDPVYVSFPKPVKVSNNGHRYLWGKFQLTNRNGKVRVVEVLPLEQYVAGISEMPAAWPLEALMAQAIAARTYAHEVTLHRRNSAEWAQEYDISGSTVDQNYIGYDAQDSAWDQKWLAAVSATAGIEIVDANGPIRAYYSASNGGYTETAAYVFANDVPYTVAGPDPYDAGGHDWTDWTRTYSQSAMSRWLGKSADTAVGTLTSIEVLGGAGASARLDKAVVELVGTGGTKRVTGKRLMLVINAGVFGEGGGLSTHLPGTFTTIGNGAGVGRPQPGGVQAPATVTPDPLPEGVRENAAFVPPPGWRPEPGTGVPPGAPTQPVDQEVAALVDDLTGDGTGDPSDEDTATEAGAAVTGSTAFVPPPGWKPEPGTGVPPGRPVAPGQAAPPADDAAATAFVPPPGWKPEPGTGVPPGRPVAPGQAAPPADDAAAAAFVPPPGWKPEPGTGVPPGRAVAPNQAAPTLGSADTVGSADLQPAPPADSAPVEDAPQDDQAPATPAEPAEPAEPAQTATPSVGASQRVGFTPPADWKPAPGTGVPPGTPVVPSAGFVGGTGGGDATSSGVFLVTRTADSAALTEATFRVIAPTEALAAEARTRLQELQAKAALGLFADVDINGYVAAVAPRPVHGVCTATPSGVTCIPLELLKGPN